MNLREFLIGVGYTDLRIVRGKVCGLREFSVMTAGLLVGLCYDGCEAAYEFENECDARAALAAWDGLGHPPGPWLKLIGAHAGRRVEWRNPAFPLPVFGRVAHA